MRLRAVVPFKRARGFTLVEIIAVIVVLSITSVIGAGFITSVVEQYQKAKLRSELVLKGSVALEQLTRKLRMSVPNSLRVSVSGNCIEYMPLIGGAFYREQVPDMENSMALTSSVTTMAFSLGGAQAKHVLISPLSDTEIYLSGTPAARVNAGDFGEAPYTQAVLNNLHRFIRNSLNSRLLIATDPERFCVLGDRLVRYQNYGFLTTAVTDGSPGGSEVLMSSGVAAGGRAFALSPNSEDRNSAIDITLIFSAQQEQITLTSRVLVRNLP